MPPNQDTTNLWPALWALDDFLDRETPPFSEIAERLLDPTSQAFLFLHRSFTETRLLPWARAAGVFVVPRERPANKSWPPIYYLKEVAAEEPQAVAEVLRDLRTDDPFLLDIALSVAVDLRAESDDVLIPLIDQWLDARFVWMNADLWARVLRQLAQSTADRRSVATDVVLSATTSGSDYELGRLCDGLAEFEQHDWVLDVVEGATLAALAKEPRDEATWPISELQEDFPRGASATLVRAWLRALADSSASAARAQRLLGASHQWARQMGLRALRHSLRLHPMSQLAADLLEHVSSENKYLEYAYRAEFLPLLGENFHRLQPGRRAALINRTLTQVADEEERQWSARDVLGALRQGGHLGPVESRALESLEEELGPYQPDRQTLGLTLHEVPDDPVLSQLSSFTAADLLAMLRNPQTAERSFGQTSSIDSLTVGLQRDVPNRPDVYLSLMNAHSSAISTPAIHEAVCRALVECVKAGNNEIAEPVVAYLEAIVHQFAGLDSEGVNLRRTVGWLVMDLVALPAHRPLVSSLARKLLDDPSPVTSDADDSYGDLLTAALNVVRGIGARACFALLAGSLETDDADEVVADALSARLQAEKSPAVLAVFGMYLNLSLARTGSALERAIRARLDGRNHDPDGWSAIFSGYLVTNRASVNDSQLLRDFQYSLEVGPAQNRPLALAWASLVAHIQGNYFLGPDPTLWQPLVHPALDLATVEQRDAALRGLGRALHDLEADRIPSLIAFINQRRAPASAMGELTSDPGLLADLLVDADLPLDQVGPLLLDLVRRGATPDGAGLMDYLRRRQSSAPVIAGRTLAEYLTQVPPVWAWSRELDAVNDIVAALMALASPDVALAQRIVDILAREWMFRVEDAARQAYRDS